MKLVYKRYASLYFCVCVDVTDNELYVLEVIHHFVEVLDKYFGNVCELDLIFNFHKAYYILDETLISGQATPLTPSDFMSIGELQEPSKKSINRVVEAGDRQIEQDKIQASHG